MVEPGETFWWRKEMMVLPLKSGITFMRTRPEPLPRLSTATRTSAARRPLSCRLPRRPACSPPIHVSSTFYLTVQRFPSYTHHRPTELVKQHPGGLVTGQAEVPLE